MTVILLLMTAALVVPHLVSLERASAAIAASIWLAAIMLRALATLFAVVLALRYIPTTGLFSLATRWCWHGVVPPLATHLPLSGHALGNAAVILPSLVVAVSTVSMAFGLWRAARHVRAMITRSLVGPGPRESLLLADRDVIVAAAGLYRPQVIVSAGALVAFDDAELAASLEHERGHIARFHRYALVAAEVCRAAARFLPGTRAATAELAFHLERDADRYAIEARHDPAALASAICKAAQTAVVPPPSFALSGGAVRRRVRLLLDPLPPASRTQNGWLRLLACAMLTTVLLASTVLPAAAHEGLESINAAALLDHCPG